MKTEIKYRIKNSKDSIIFLNSSELAVQKIHKILNTAFPDQPYA